MGAKIRENHYIVYFNQNDYFMGNKHNWKFSKVGGVTRVNIETGEDMTSLEQLDQKMWTVLSCPVDGLEFDAETLKLLDSDHDGRIRVGEVKAASSWLGKVLAQKDILVEAPDSMPLAAINRDSEEGEKLYGSAVNILKNLGRGEDACVSLSDLADSVAIFKGTRFNGDGVVTPCSTDDAALKDAISKVMACIGKTPDRSGEDGINQEQADAFYKACADYAAWLDAAEADKAKVFPYGDATPAAYSAVCAVKDKVEDFFVRCRLAAFDNAAVAALDVNVDRIAAISAGNLAEAGKEIADYPLARVNTEGVLPLGAVNPAWRDAVEALKTSVLGEDAASMTEKEWNAIKSAIAPYAAWLSAKAGEQVEPLGEAAVRAVLAENRKAEIDSLIAQDKALEAEVKGVENVCKLLHYVRWFGSFVRNFVTFADFYNPDTKAIFQAGDLYIDQRCCQLCIKVTDNDSKGSIAALSGMYVVYCDCTSRVCGATMKIAAIITDGDVNDIRVGKNCVFYDRNGLDWDAVVTKIIDNPISIRQAFWSPYHKLARTIGDRITKSANERSAKVDAALTDKVSNVSLPTDASKDAAPKPADSKPAFDIAKFAGIFAAIGMAVGYLTAALAKLVTPWYNILLVLLILVVVVSGPSMFLAWQKIRRRNISPVLNNNGWAMNATALVNATFGATLTTLAKFPIVVLPDPYAPKKKHCGLKIALVLLAVIVIAFVVMYFAGWLAWLGIEFLIR